MDIIKNTYQIFTATTLVTAIQKHFGWGYNVGELAPWCIFLSFGFALILSIGIYYYQESK